MRLRDTKSQQQYNSFVPGLQVQREPASWKPWSLQGRQQRPLLALPAECSWKLELFPSPFPPPSAALMKGQTRLDLKPKKKKNNLTPRALSPVDLSLASWKSLPFRVLLPDTTWCSELVLWDKSCSLGYFSVRAIPVWSVACPNLKGNLWELGVHVLLWELWFVRREQEGYAHIEVCAGKSWESSLAD